MIDATENQIDLMLRSHTEMCLTEIWERPEIIADGDGDYPFRYGTAACWVRVVEHPEREVRVFAHAAFGVKKSAKLLAELNELNERSRWVKVSLQGHIVVVSGALHWTAVGCPALNQVMRAAATVADDIGTMIATVHGGQTPFEPSEEELAEPGEAA